MEWNQTTIDRTKRRKYFDYSIEVEVHWTNQIHFHSITQLHFIRATFDILCNSSSVITLRWIVGCAMTRGRKIDMRTVNHTKSRVEARFQNKKYRISYERLFYSSSQFLSSLNDLIWFDYHFSPYLFLTVMHTTCGTIKKSRGSLSCCLSSFSHREQWTAVIPHESLQQWCRATANWSWCWNVRSRTPKVGIQWLGKFHFIYIYIYIESM
jgi:hypothetical protein